VVISQHHRIITKEVEQVEDIIKCQAWVQLLENAKHGSPKQV
jgi:hypothetical protein